MNLKETGQWVFDHYIVGATSSQMPTPEVTELLMLAAVVLATLWLLKRFVSLVDFRRTTSFSTYLSVQDGRLYKSSSKREHAETWKQFGTLFLFYDSRVSPVGIFLFGTHYGNSKKKKHI